MDRLSRLFERLSSESELWWFVREMADYCHLSKVFKRIRGISPDAYREKFRI